MNMLFNFQTFVEELREKPDKKEIVEKYEKHFGAIEGDIADQLWYKNYLINFSTIAYAVPKELKDEFDWSVLLQLIAASFSSECIFEKLQEAKEDGIEYDLTISVKSGDQSVVKKISELWSFQIIRLYEIYVEEQMNLEVLCKEEEKEKNAIVSQRQARLQRWRTLLETLDREELTAQANAEKEKKLDDLYGQL